MTFLQAALGDLDGADPGLDISAVTKAVNSLTPLSHAGAHAMMGWGLRMLHAAYGYDVTSIGNAKQQLTRALDNARIDLESLDMTIDGDPDPLGDGEAAAVREAIIRGVIAYNQAAQAASDSAQNTKLLFEDLKTNLVQLPSTIGGAIGNVAGGLLGGIFSNPWTLGALAVGGALLVYGLTRKRGT